MNTFILRFHSMGGYADLTVQATPNRQGAIIAKEIGVALMKQMIEEDRNDDLTLQVVDPKEQYL